MLRRVRSRRWLAPLMVIVLAVMATPPAVANGTGYLTDQPSMLTPAAPGVSVLPIIGSGETPDGLGGFTFSGIPDGIGAMPGAVPGTVDVFVNHEESHVPFTGLADFQDSSVSRLTLDTTTGEVLEAEVALDPALGFLRFCSATMAGPDEGLDRHLFFTNEETNDVVPVPAGAPYGPDPAISPNRQGGYVTVLDPATGDTHVLLGAGRHNHENDVVVPGGWDQIAVLSGDDTFFTSPLPDWSQVYMYLADDTDALVDDRGSLWAFRVTHDEDGMVAAADPFNGANDYGDIEDGDSWRGRYIRVPDKVARGLTAQAPQDALEDWSNAHNVFQFIRAEDIAYDPNDPRVVYIADTGDRRMVADPATGRLTRLPQGTVGAYPNGRIYRMEFSADNPRKVVDFSILLDSDLAGLDAPAAMHQPDNLGTSANSLMVQEDTSQAPGSRIWRYDLEDETWTVVASVVNGLSNESSGIVDASAWFGPGTWFVTVQQHDTFVQRTVVSPTLTLKREGGQFALLTVIGS